MPSKWPIAGGPLMARCCVLAGIETDDSRQEIKGDNISSVNMARQFTFIIYLMLLPCIKWMSIKICFSFNFLRS